MVIIYTSFCFIRLKMTSLISNCPFVSFNVNSIELNEDIQRILEKMVQYYIFLKNSITGYDGMSLEYIQLIIDYISKEYTTINVCSDAVVDKSDLVIDDKVSFLRRLFNQIYPKSEIDIIELNVNSIKYLCFNDKGSCVIVNVKNICELELQFLSIMSSIVVSHEFYDIIASVLFKMIMNINACQTEYEVDKTLLYHTYNIKSLVRFNIDPKVCSGIRTLINNETLTTSRQSIIGYNIESFVKTEYDRPNISISEGRPITVQNLTFFGKCADELGNVVSYSVESAKYYYDYVSETVKELSRHI